MTQERDMTICSREEILRVLLHLDSKAANSSNKHTRDSSEQDTSNSRVMVVDAKVKHMEISLDLQLTRKPSAGNAKEGSRCGANSHSMEEGTHIRSDRDKLSMTVTSIEISMATSIGRPPTRIVRETRTLFTVNLEVHSKIHMSSKGPNRVNHIKTMAERVRLRGFSARWKNNSRRDMKGNVYSGRRTKRNMVRTRSRGPSEILSIHRLRTGMLSNDLIQIVLCMWPSAY